MCLTRDFQSLFWVHFRAVSLANRDKVIFPLENFQETVVDTLCLLTDHVLGTLEWTQEVATRPLQAVQPHVAETVAYGVPNPRVVAWRAFMSNPLSNEKVALADGWLQPVFHNG